MERDVNASAIAEHVWNEHHRMDWSAAEVADTEQYLYPRLLLESWHIHSEQNPMNRERGLLPTGVLLTHQEILTIFVLSLHRTHFHSAHAHACVTVSSRHLINPLLLSLILHSLMMASA